MVQQNIFVISDYGIGDAAFAEVILQLRMLLPDVFIYPQSVPSFSTICTGFWIQQIGLTSNITNTYIYSNTAPRKESHNEQRNNKGEKLMYAKLKNGVEIMAVNAGYVFSFIKDHITQFHYVDVENEGSQFRSRDKYPPAVWAMVQGHAPLAEKEDISIIPDYPRNVIASIDGYGNLKTTAHLSDTSYTPGQKITITINNISHPALFTDGSFNVKSGELAFAPGSSGHANPFMEIFLRGASAYELFKKPLVESEFALQA